MPDPVRLSVRLVERVWGRTNLAPWYPEAARPIGEAWFTGPQDLPLLVKLIFTSERLSVQVHPDDGEDGLPGKTEMWHILEAEPGASIALGFREPITRERLRESAQTGEIEGLLNWVPVKAGETYFTPAHTVHAIGAGIVLCEIQQNSDITYRLWDYGRPRELHLEKAVPLCDLGVHPGATPAGEPVLCKHFVTEAVEVHAGQQIAPEAHRCHLWICLAGEATIGSETVQAGEVWMLPEEGSQPMVKSESGTRFLHTWVP
jgi:mannose-6-phosphate isomerase